MNLSVVNPRFFMYLNSMTISQHIFITFLALVVCLLCFEYTPIDMWIEAVLYDDASRQWLWSGGEQISRFIFYNGMKDLLVVFTLGLLACVLFFRNAQFVQRYRNGLIIVLLSLLLVPLTVGELKATTNVACPKALTEFGGRIHHIGLFDHYSADEKPEKPQMCFPAGHASGGFALMSLFFLFRSERNRKKALLFGAGMGWIMGGYKMLIGDHFFSHTLVSMMLAWLIICIIVALVDGLPEPESLNSAYQAE